MKNTRQRTANALNTKTASLERHQPDVELDRERHTINIKEKGSKKMSTEEMFNPVRISADDLAPA